MENSRKTKKGIGGRPRKPPADRRDRTIQLRVTAAELAELRRLAEPGTISELLRSLALGQVSSGQIPTPQAAPDSPITEGDKDTAEPQMPRLRRDSEGRLYLDES